MMTQAKIKLLQDNGWHVEYVDKVFFIQNENTGCSIRGEFAEKFALDKVEEIKEELGIENKEKLSKEEILEREGFFIICESPYEIRDRQGNMITGECAKWLEQELVTTYERSCGY